MSEDKKKGIAGTNELNKNQSQHVGLNDEAKKTNDKEVGSNETEVKNANAAGLGALGRNDEKLTETGGSTPGDAGDY